MTEKQEMLRLYVDQLDNIRIIIADGSY